MTDHRRGRLMRVGMTACALLCAACSEPATSAPAPPADQDAGRDAGKVDAGDAGANDGGRGRGPSTWDTGWTEFEQAPGSLTVYVSSSAGSDENTGLSPSDPVQTIAKGYSLLRDGHSDWLLLKSGDTWSEGYEGLSKSGAAERHPMLISTYGQGARPVLTGRLTSSREATVDYFAIVGLHLKQTQLRWNCRGDRLLLEDMVFERTQGISILMEARGEREHELTNVTVRRCIVFDAWQPLGGDHTHGAYFHGIVGLTLEENVFDHNGYYLDGDESYQSIFCRNVYIQASVKMPVLVRGNIFTRSGSEGIQVRPGGVMEDNFLAHNTNGFDFGAVRGDAVKKGMVEKGAVGRVVRNVVIQSGDMRKEAETVPYSRGMILANLIGSESTSTPVLVSDNIIARAGTRHEDCSGCAAIKLDADLEGSYGIHYVRVQDNVIYDWANGIEIGGGLNPDIEDNDNPGYSDLEVTGSQVQAGFGQYLFRFTNAVDEFDPGELRLRQNVYHALASDRPFRIPKDTARSYQEWSDVTQEQGSSWQQISYRDPDRTAASYAADKLGQEASFEALAGALRLRARGDWPCQLTAYGINDYIRQGFADPASGAESWICDPP